jgi:hypothetical protein
VIVTESYDYTSVRCYHCGIIFLIPSALDKNRCADHKTFFCPNGHANTHQAETEAERYLRWYEDYQTRWQNAERSNSSLRGQVTKLKNKLAEEK